VRTQNTKEGFGRDNVRERVSLNMLMENLLKGNSEMI
jgi:hypothetical protein